MKLDKKGAVEEKIYSTDRRINKESLEILNQLMKNLEENL